MTNGSRGKGGLIKAGQLDFLQQFARDPAPITRAQEKLITSGKAISQSPPSSAEMAYLHSVLCQVGLPRSAVGEREFMRRSGRAWL